MKQLSRLHRLALCTMLMSAAMTESSAGGAPVVEKTAEQVEAEKNAAADQAAAAKAEAKALKDAEKARVAAEKKAAKEKADAARAEEKAKTDAEKKRVKAEKERLAKEAAEKKAAEAAAKQEAKTKVVQPSQNGITRPRPEGECGKVWALADSESARLSQPVPIAELMKATRAAGLNDATTRTQYARWKTFNGVFGTVPKLPAAPVAEQTADNASNDTTNVAAA
jgi:flagellar biosynthesis GTPase FlhF